MARDLTLFTRAAISRASAAISAMTAWSLIRPVVITQPGSIRSERVLSRRTVATPVDECLEECSWTIFVGTGQSRCTETVLIPGPGRCRDWVPQCRLPVRLDRGLWRILFCVLLVDASREDFQRRPANICHRV